jgi:hypothetical protein
MLSLPGYRTFLKKRGSSVVGGIKIASLLVRKHGKHVPLLFQYHLFQFEVVKTYTI